MKGHKGQSLIEILLAAALLIILLPALFSGILATRDGRAQQQQRIAASLLLRETEEILKVVRERGWSLFSTNGTFHPNRDGNTWTLSAGTDVINGLTRQVVISDVFRDENGFINQSGNLDPSTKKIEVTISWNNPFSSNIYSQSYLTRYLDNLAFIETTESDFILGEKTGTTVVNGEGGEIILGAGGSSNWCVPDVNFAAELDLPKQGVAQAISAIENQLIAGTGENASGVSIAKVNISNDNPPTAQIDGEFNGYKTNDVFIESHYAYIAADNNQTEVIIIDILNTPFIEVGSVALPGSQNADSVVTSDQLGLVVQNNTLWSFDLSSKNGARPLLDSDGVILAGTGKEIVIVGNFAYVAIDGNPELQIIDISDPTNLSIVAWADVNGLGAQDVVVSTDGTRSYIVTSHSDSLNELFIIDTSSKLNDQSTIGSYDSSGMNPKAVLSVPGNKIIMGGIGGQEYQVIDITNETNPSNCGGIEIDSGVNDLDAILETDGDAYSYVLTGDSTSELKIVEGGPGGQFATEGTFESSIFDPNYSVVFNRFEVIDTVLAGTELKYQVAVTDPVSGNCLNSTYNYIGPDGTGATFFTDDSPIPLDNNGIGYENPGQCFRYKAYFSTNNIGSSPSFEEIRVNYSP
ncbi:MAG: hypothetical protein OEX81_02735 [Candidatus Pacebacteria bacterium]|nr:hypothetical protein [Candidatus Paceibacterota bacterium]